MDEPALRVLISSLEQQLSTLEEWLYFWTMLVIVGCAGELFFVIHEYLDNRKLWNRARTKGFVANPEKPSGFVLIFEVLSVAFVVIGIAGELYLNWQSSDLQTKLRNANGSLILLFEKEAGDAKESALRAAAAADRANVAATGAQKKAELVAKKEKLVEKEAQSLKYVLDMAAWNLNPRTVGDPESLKNSLARYKGMPVTFGSYLNDGEPYFLCLQLADIARSAQMVVTDQCAVWKPSATPTKGILVSTPSAELSVEFIMLLSKLPELGPGLEARNDSPFLQIFVGKRYGFPTTVPTIEKQVPIKRRKRSP